MDDLAHAAERRREQLGSAHLRYATYMDEQTVRLTTGELLSFLQIGGFPFETADMDEINAHHRALNGSLVNLASGQVMLWSVVLRRRAAEYPEGQFTSAFLTALDAKHRERMNGSDLFRNHLFLAVVTVPKAAPADKLFAALFARGKGPDAAAEAEMIDFHKEKVLAVRSALANVGVRVLGIYEDQGIAWSEAATVLHWMLGGRQRRVPVTQGPVWSAAYQDRVVFGREQFEVRHPEGTKVGGIFGIKEYPTTTRPTMFDALLTAPMELMVVQSFRFLPKGDARALIQLRYRQVVRSRDGAAKQAPQLAHAEQELADNAFALGEHQGSVTVFADDAKRLNELMADMRQSLMDGGAVVSREDMGLEAAFWAQMPGNARYRARRGHITTRNFAALAPFHGFPVGTPVGNHWGPAVAMLRTSSGSPFFFNWHVNDLGNTFICGPSGSGKTVVMNFLLAQSMKHDPRIVVFDKDRGCELFVRAVGGSYLTLRSGQPTGCAPLKALDLSAGKSLQWLARWVESLAGGIVTSAERDGIASALDALAAGPRELRTIAGLRVYLDGTSADGVSKRLEAWQWGKPLGWVFDCPEDLVALDARVIGYDMTDVLDTPQVRGPMMDYLFHRIEKLITGERLIIAIDEFWKALEDTGFRAFIQDRLKTIRKQNGLLVFATQSPRDALRSPIAHTIIEQCPTQIFMPNGKGQAEDYRGGMKLSAREFALVSEILSVGSRRFLVKQNQAGVVAELNLGGFDDELAILSGRTASVEMLDEIRAEVGDNPAAWLRVLLDRMRAPQARAA